MPLRGLQAAQNFQCGLFRGPGLGIGSRAVEILLMHPVALASGVVLAVVGLWRRYGRHSAFAPNVGPVSEGWLAEQRAQKDSLRW